MIAKQALFSWGNSAPLVVTENADTQLNQKGLIHSEKKFFPSEKDWLCIFFNSLISSLEKYCGKLKEAGYNLLFPK